MPSFVWKGRTRSGQVQEGQLLADSRDAAVAVLRRQQIQITSIRERGREIKLMPRIPRGVGSKRIAIFTRQFSVMLDAGLPLVQCLEILGEQEENRTFQAIIQQVRGDVEAGSSLADAMRKHPKAFDNLYTNMVAAGEAGGILDIILQRLSVYIEKVVRLNSQVKSALIYPTAVIVIATGVVFVILKWVIPVFAQLFASLSGEMPFLTKMVIGASNFVSDYFIFIVLVLIFGTVAINRWHKTPHGRRVLDGLLLKIPVIGMLLRKIAVARFCRTLSTLTASGVPILDGLEITAKTAGNAIISFMLEGLCEGIVVGRKAGLSLEKIVEVVMASGYASPYFTFKGDAIAKRDFSTHFSIDLLVKDQTLMLAEAARRKASMPGLAAIREVFQSARGQGHGQEDIAAVVKALEKASGV